MLTDELKIINDKIKEQAGLALPEDDLNNFINSGSKRIRSKLALIYIKMFSCNIDDNLYNLMAATELIHNASLLHDDVIDNSDIRRNKTTIAKKYSYNISILCGDYLVSRAIELLSKINNSKILLIFNECVKNMSLAEINQYFQRGIIPTKEQYIDICKGKTAELFSAILKSSAILCGLEPEMGAKFGELFGICFQIKNDIEEYSAKEDVRNKIYTAPTIWGIENTLILLDNYKEEMRTMLADLSENDFKRELEGMINKL